MRLALFSDVHGNPIALEAVLADIQSLGGVDAYLVLGDLAALGYDPAATLERLAALPEVHFVRGNTDRYLVTGQRPPPTVEDVRQGNLALLPQLIEVTQGFAWTQGFLTATGWLDWLAALPVEQRLVLPDGTRLLGVHAAPGTDDGEGIHPGYSDDALYTILHAGNADLICVGHTHVPLDRTVYGCRVVNPGSLSNPATTDLRAAYVLLEADTFGYQLHFRRVDYDREQVIAALKQSRYPSAGFIVRHLRGQIRSPWASA